MSSTSQKSINTIVARLYDAEPIADDHIQQLLSNLDLYISIDEIWDNQKAIEASLAAGSPAITGASWISCSIIGPVWVHDFAMDAGVVAGCGAIVLPVGTEIPAGSIIWLRAGVVVRSLDQLKTCIVGNINDVKRIELSN
ncbi:MAG: hypothetical protein J0M02_00970 [Planctomycetes bacterium]|nr:hypothetical protein [Planctomycetota bacterium]